MGTKRTTANGISLSSGLSSSSTAAKKASQSTCTTLCDRSLPASSCASSASASRVALATWCSFSSALRRRMRSIFSVRILSRASSYSKNLEPLEVL